MTQRFLWPSKAGELDQKYLEDLKASGIDEWAKQYLGQWPMEDKMEHYFVIKFTGPRASGKTVAMKHVEKALQEQGYVVTRAPVSDHAHEHMLKVNW